MDIKEKTRMELEDKVEELEEMISKKGVGSDYVQKVERIQRDVNLALLLGASAAFLGITAWLIISSKDE